MIRKPFSDTHLRPEYHQGAQDSMTRFMLADGTIRGALVRGTWLVNQARANHELGIFETLALGQGLLAALLAATSQKGAERLSLRFDTSGPLKGMNVEATGTGTVRGYLFNPHLEILTPPESFDLAPYWGGGMLTVTRVFEQSQHPFSGTVELVHHSVAEDLSRYFQISEQNPTLFNLSITFSPRGEVTGSVGLMLQALPGAAPATLADLDERIALLPSLAKIEEEGQDFDTFISDAFRGFNPQLLDKNPVSFYCSCNRVRFGRFLAALPERELTEMIEKGPLPIVTVCHNCNSHFSFQPDEISAFTP